DTASVNFPMEKVGIGTNNPNKQFHIFASSTNAEIDLQSGNNTHWGIYQDNASGKLNFWHNDNQVIFSDKGVSAKAFCLNNYCIDDWADLKAILENNDSIIDRDVQIQP
ncbi:MAG: hypothetical protein Q8O32_03010, partial [bacterium]|nr:hypothetical protein [bacterium]